MPTYVYGCDACGHQFEQFQKITDAPIRQCPRCDSKVRRIFQPAGIVFKGSGWHITDYKRSSNGSEASTNGDGKSASAKAGDGKAAASEQKPETSSDSKSEKAAAP